MTGLFITHSWELVLNSSRFLTQPLAEVENDYEVVYKNLL